jgi:predicted transcriptional regulator
VTKKTEIRARPKKSAYVGVSVEPEIKASLEQIARTEDRSVGSVIREAFRLFLERRHQAAA